MRIDNFEDIVAWRKAKELTRLLYKLFRNSRDFSFRDQILRASISIMNNIAEGFERKSNKELKQFLFIAKGSCGEVRSMIILAQDLNYIDEIEFSQICSLSLEISRLLSGFITL
ncbi:four helix bundle protein [Candidatus Gottesmanbacteria bacterium]|nr:four helix bundle protein [Candidatus Gottesmanbacteria bacterium]